MTTKNTTRKYILLADDVTGYVVTISSSGFTFTFGNRKEAKRFTLTEANDWMLATLNMRPLSVEELNESELK